MAVGIARPSCTAAVRGSCCALLLVSLVVSLAAPIAMAQTPVRKTVLIINEVGLAHPASAMVTERVMSRMAADPRYQIEFYVESLDSTLFADEKSENDNEDRLVGQYRDRKVDVIVAVGPRPLRLLARVSGTFLPNVPVVFCGSAPVQAGNPKLSSRFTGSWLNLDVAKTLEAAMRLSPGFIQTVPYRFHWISLPSTPEVVNFLGPRILKSKIKFWWIVLIGGSSFTPAVSPDLPRVSRS